MPPQYTAMRDHFIRQGLGEMAAKKKAARIYNSKHPNAPVGRYNESPGRIDNQDNRDNRDNRGGTE